MDAACCRACARGRRERHSDAELPTAHSVGTQCTRPRKSSGSRRAAANTGRPRLIEAADGGTHAPIRRRRAVDHRRRREPSRANCSTRRSQPSRRRKWASGYLAELPAGFRVHITPHYVVMLQHVAHVRPVDQLAAGAALQSVHRLLEEPGPGAARAGVPAARAGVRRRQSYEQASRTICPMASATSSASTACVPTA